MEVEKARMEAKLNALKQEGEGEAEATLAAARVLEAAVLDQSDDLAPRAESINRTEEYVKSHFQNNSNTKNETNDKEEYEIDKSHDIDPNQQSAAVYSHEYPTSPHPRWQPRVLSH